MADVAAKTALDGTMCNLSEVVNRAERLCAKFTDYHKKKRIAVIGSDAIMSNRNEKDKNKIHLR